MTKLTEQRRAQTLIGIVFLLWMVSPSPVLGQETPPAGEQQPKSPEVKKLEEEKARAVLRQQIAEANKAELDARFPKPTSTPLAGQTTINDGALIEGQMMAYVSMAKAANRIVSAIRSKSSPLGIKSLAIYNERDVNLLLSYDVATKQIGAIQKQYCDIIFSRAGGPCPKAPTPGPAGLTTAPLSIAGSFLGGFVDLTAFFRTNVDIKGQTFEITEGPLVAEVFRAARRPQSGLAGVNLYYPFVIPPDLTPDSASQILGLLEKVRELRIDAGKLVTDAGNNDQETEKTKASIEKIKGAIETLAAAEVDATNAAMRILKVYCPKIAAQPDDILDKILKAQTGACRRLPPDKLERLLELQDNIKDVRANTTEANTSLAKAKAKLVKLENDRVDLKKALRDSSLDLADAIAFLKAANEQFDKFVTSIVQADASAGVNPLTSYIRAERLKEMLGKSGGYWLQLKVMNAGGNNRIKTNLIIDIFTAGNRLSHSGGTVVEYNLFNTSGQSVASDTITEYINYIKADRIKNLPCTDVDDFGEGKKDCLKEVSQD